MRSEKRLCNRWKSRSLISVCFHSRFFAVFTCGKSVNVSKSSNFVSISQGKKVAKPKITHRRKICGYYQIMNWIKLRTNNASSACYHLHSSPTHPHSAMSPAVSVGPQKLNRKCFRVVEWKLKIEKFDAEEMKSSSESVRPSRIINEICASLKCFHRLQMLREKWSKVL